MEHEILNNQDSAQLGIPRVITSYFIFLKTQNYANKRPLSEL